MSTVIITTSPKKHHQWANSTYAALLVRIGCGGQMLRLQGQKDYAQIKSACEKADRIVLAMPLYVDSIPAQVLTFLQSIEEDAKEWNATLYVISCCGFFEGWQTRLQLEQVKCWCKRTGVCYGGGLGVGATEMLGTIRFTNLFACVPMGLIVGVIVGLCSRSLHSALVSGLTSFTIPLLLYLLWSSGFFYHTLRFGRKIKHGIMMKDRFTTVWFCGRPLFTFFASLFWVIRAAKNKVSFKKMWQKLSV